MAGSTRWRKHTHQLQHVDGVMLGRAAYADPYLMADVDRALFGASEPPPSRLDVLDRFMPYVADEISRGTGHNQMTRHILGCPTDNHTRAPSAGISLRLLISTVQGSRCSRPRAVAPWAGGVLRRSQPNKL